MRRREPRYQAPYLHVAVDAAVSVNVVEAFEDLTPDGCDDDLVKALRSASRNHQHPCPTPEPLDTC